MSHRRATAEELGPLAHLIRAARAGSINAFCALCVGDHTGAPVVLAHIHQVINAFIDYCWSQWPPLYCGILAPWRHGKTRAGIVARSAHVVGLNPSARIRIICADDRESVLRVSDVRRIIESRRFRSVFPSVVPQKGEWLKHQFTVHRPGGGPDPTVSAAGVFSAEAGGGHDYLMFDDIVDYQNCYLKPAQREDVFASLTSVWLRRIDPRTRVLMVGTAWHSDDAYHRLKRGEAGEGQWRWLVVSVNEAFNGLSCRIE